MSTSYLVELKTVLHKGTFLLFFMNSIRKSVTYIKGVVRGGVEGARVPPEFGRSVKPYSNQRGQIMPLTILPAPRIQKAIYTSEVYRYPPILKI